MRSSTSTKVRPIFTPIPSLPLFPRCPFNSSHPSLPPPRCPWVCARADPDGDEISVDGTIKLCEELGVDPEDVVLLAVAYELKSPAMGQWTRKGWTDGWKALG